MFDLINELVSNDVRMEMSSAKTYEGALLLQFHKGGYHAGYIIQKDQLTFFRDELAGLFYDFFERFMGDYNRHILDKCCRDIRDDSHICKSDLIKID